MNWGTIYPDYEAYRTPEDNFGDATITILRPERAEDVGTYISVAVAFAPEGALEPVIIVMAIDEDSNEVELTYQEFLETKRRVLAGEDDTGR